MSASCHVEAAGSECRVEQEIALAENRFVTAHCSCLETVRPPSKLLQLKALRLSVIVLRDWMNLVGPSASGLWNMTCIAELNRIMQIT